MSLNRKLEVKNLKHIKKKKVADEEWKCFPKNSIFKIKLQFVGSTVVHYCDKTDGLSIDELRTLSSAQIVGYLTQNIIKETIEVKKRDRAG